MSDLVSILFTETREGKPGVVVNGHFIGYARRIEFSTNRYSSTGVVLVASRIQVDPSENITGIPHSRHIPHALEEVVELTKKDEEKTDG